MMLQIMGILNVTPDSFFDGGRYYGLESAVSAGHRMAAEGADIVDVGGESTRPGAVPLNPAEELRRAIPVIRELSPSYVVSIDTRHETVARAAVDVGARIINDVSCSLFRVAAELEVGWIGMHAKGDPQTMQVRPSYVDVVEEVHNYLTEKVKDAKIAGVHDIWIDPGFGFGKSNEHNMTLLSRLAAFKSIDGARLAVGLSRKNFIGHYSRAQDPTDRLPGSLIAALAAAQRGADLIRTHDVKATRACLDMQLNISRADSILEAGGGLDA